MLTVLLFLILCIVKPGSVNWVERLALSLMLIIDTVLEVCGLIALYNLFTRL